MQGAWDEDVGVPVLEVSEDDHMELALEVVFGDVLQTLMPFSEELYLGRAYVLRGLGFEAEGLEEDDCGRWCDKFLDEFSCFLDFLRL